MPIVPDYNVNQQFVPDVINWQGSNRVLQFQNHGIGTTYLTRPGVYIFCRQALNGYWYAVYVGETDNFARRLTHELACHHAWDRIRSAGATHICTLHVPGGLAERLAIETELRHTLKPPCNRQ